MKVKEENVPVLRFPEFEGEWELTNLGNESVCLDNKRVPIEAGDRLKRRGKYPYYGASGIIDYIDGYLFDETLVLLAEDGANILMRNSPIAFLAKGKYWVNNHAHVYRANGSPEFLATYLENLRYEKYNTGTAQPKLNGEVCKKLKLTFPPLPEQQKIASFLTAGDTKIEQLNKKKALLEQYKKGMMQKLFSQELRFKDEQGNDFPDWEEKRLKDYCQINPKTKRLPTEFVYIDLESVENGMLLQENTIFETDAPSRAQRVLSKHDVLFQMVRPCQKNNYYFNKDGNYVASTGYAQLRSHESAMFLYQVIHTNLFVDKVMARCTGTSYPAINSSDLGEIAVLFPTAPEQQKIADFLSSLDKKITLISTELTHAQTFKKGLLQQMFV